MSTTPVRESPAAEGLEALTLDFFRRWSESFEACCTSFEDMLDERCVWDQRPVPKLTGPVQAVRFLKIARRTLGLDTIDVEVLHVASHGPVVHVERIDRLRRADGSLIAAAPVVGVLTFEGGKVQHWREYFDSAEFVAQIVGRSVAYLVRRAARLRP